jgi:hypothetical protein
MISLGMDFDHDAWTRPEDEVRPSADLADLYGEGFEDYLARVDSARELWGR